MDDLEDALRATRERLAEAVSRESYEEAAALKETYGLLEVQDTTLEIERAFKAAIREERYADAAKLRDEGGTGLTGWWVGREGDGGDARDMAGHLIEVRRGVGRYVGVAFDPNSRETETGVFEVFYKRAGDDVVEVDRGIPRYASQATVFDGRMIFVEDEGEDGIYGEEWADDREYEEEWDNDGEQIEGGEPIQAIEVVRQRAEIEWVDRDRFVLRIDDDGSRDGDGDPMGELEEMVMQVVSGNDSSSGGDAEENASTTTTTTTYRRLTPDEMRGLYLGSFGPHGREVVHIYETMVDGKRMVEGRKVTGDVNVPAGEVSFRARVDRDNARRGDDGKYPPEYGVLKRYPGQGRVAREGFVDAKWVDGELLELSPTGGKFAGAEWGFVFEVGEERRFLLLFERLQLDPSVTE